MTGVLSQRTDQIEVYFDHRDPLLLDVAGVDQDQALAVGLALDGEPRTAFEVVPELIGAENLNATAPPTPPRQRPYICGSARPTGIAETVGSAGSCTSTW